MAPSVLAVILLLLTGAMMPVLAQSCTSDSQCRDFGQTRTHCSGNSLVTTQSRCIGSCRSVEVSRIPCPGPCVGDRCIGGPLTREPGNPPIGGGGVAAGVCGTICTCEGKRLTYALGFAKSADQCRRRTINCVYGCTCDPEPRCLRRGES